MTHQPRPSTWLRWPRPADHPPALDEDHDPDEPMCSNCGRHVDVELVHGGEGHFPVIPPGVLAVLNTLSWSHAQGLAQDCEGCANDGDEDCSDPAPCPEQAEVEEDGAFQVLCNCGHEIVTVQPCLCSGPPGWHCPGEESQHWAKGEAGDGEGPLECGHCGWEDDE